MTKREFVEKAAPLLVIASWSGNVRFEEGHAAGAVRFAGDLWDEIEKQIPREPDLDEKAAST